MNNQSKQETQDAESQIQVVNKQTRQSLAKHKLTKKNSQLNDTLNEDLQELFDKIHTSLQGLLEFYGENQMNFKNDDKLNFKQQLFTQIRQTKKVLTQLNNYGKSLSNQSSGADQNNFVENNQTINQRKIKNSPIHEIFKNKQVEGQFQPERLISSQQIFKRHQKNDFSVKSTQVKQSIQYLLNLMQLLYKIITDQNQFVSYKQAIQEYESVGKGINDILKEINLSTKRVQKTKSGIPLHRILFEQLQDQHIVPENQENHKCQSMFSDNDGNQYVNQNPQDTAKAENLQDKGTSIISNLTTIYKKENDQQAIIPNAISKFNIDRKQTVDKNANLLEQEEQIIQNFENQRVIIEKLWNRFTQNNLSLQLKEKYQKIYKYFQSRYQLVSLFIGEHKLKSFLEESQGLDSDKARKIDNMIRGIDQSDDLEHLERIQAFTMTKGGIINQINKINGDINQQLAQEEYTKHVEDIQKIKIDENQRFWNELLINDSQPIISTYLNQRQYRLPQFGHAQNNSTRHSSYLDWKRQFNDKIKQMNFEIYSKSGKPIYQICNPHNKQYEQIFQLQQKCQQETLKDSKVKLPKNNLISTYSLQTSSQMASTTRSEMYNPINNALRTSQSILGPKYLSFPGQQQQKPPQMDNFLEQPFLTARYKNKNIHEQLFSQQTERATCKKLQKDPQIPRTASSKNKMFFTQDKFYQQQSTNTNRFLETIDGQIWSIRN